MTEKILHINSYYVDTHLYSKIYKKLATGFKQTVYIPIKHNRNEDNKMFIPNVELVFSKRIEKYHTVFYFNKIAKLTKDLVDRELNKGVGFIHAHNLFTDGAIALNLKRKYGIKYIVSVRMTDISMQYKYMWHRRKRAREILFEAEQIIFISPIYKDRLYEMMSPMFVKKIEFKTSVIPNGIDDFWLQTVTPFKAYDDKGEFQLIYIGQLIKRKNLDKIISVLERLNKQGTRINLVVIGGKHLNEETFYKDVVEKMNQLSFVQYKGVIRDHELLKKEIAESHALVMPSVNELFGLVFIEAISQNTPVLYPLNEGITPYLIRKNVGVGVDVSKEKDIEKGILQLKSKYDDYSDIAEVAKEFDWNRITKQFSQLYRKSIDE